MIFAREAVVAWRREQVARESVFGAHAPQDVKRRDARRRHIGLLSLQNSGFLNAIGAPAKIRAHLQSRAVQKIARRHGAFAFGLHFGDSQSRRATARDDEALFCHLTNDPRLEFTRALPTRFDARLDDLKPMAVEKSIAAREG